MKKFILSILSVSVFFIGLGGLVERTGAKFKSDERALAIIAQARQAIGGEAAIKSVRGMTITGNAEQTFTIDGAARTEQGSLEINLQMPNQFSRMLKIGTEPGDASDIKTTRVIHLISKVDNKAALSGDGAEPKQVFMMKKGEGDFSVKEGEMTNGKTVFFDHKEVPVDASRFGFRQNELFRTTFALLLSAPEGVDATYNYVGTDAVDGKNCDVIAVESGSSKFKLFIDQSSHLPAMVSYQDAIPMVYKFNRSEIRNGDDTTKNVIIDKDGSQKEIDNKTQVFVRTTPQTTGEYQIKFSDFRSAGDVQLPYKWTQTLNGQPDQTVDVVSYDVNPANIAEKFKGEKVMIRTKKAQ